MIKQSLYSIDEVERMARATHSAFRKDFPEVFAAALWGNDRGVPFVDSVTNISFIKGKVVVGAGMMSAMVNASGLVRYEIRVYETDKCVIDWFVRDGDEWIKKEHPSQHTTQRAIERNLVPLEPKESWFKDKREFNEKYANWKRSPWVCDRLAMNYNRALSIGARLYALHVFGGAVYTADELNDPDTIETVSVAPVKALAAPKRKALPEPTTEAEVVPVVPDETVKFYADKPAEEIHKFALDYGDTLTKEQKDFLRAAYTEKRAKAKSEAEAKEKLKAQLEQVNAPESSPTPEAAEAA